MPAKSAKKRGCFDPKEFLAAISEDRGVVSYSKNQRIFTQDDAANAVFYIQEGKVRLTVVSEAGKEATVGILNAGDFIGEGALAGQSLRMGSASAMTDCDLLRIEKTAMRLALQRERAFSDMFVGY